MYSLASKIGLVGLLTCTALARAADPAPDPGFQNPPDSAKPRTWWHWVSGNISAEGITADLKAMKDVGLGGAQIFTLDQSDVKGPVKFMSPEWRQRIHQALTEAGQLHLEMAMEGCEGWSISGGPWISPAQAMQHVVWSEAYVDGGRTVPLTVPSPQVDHGYYDDIALFAFPTLAGDEIPTPQRITSSTPGFNGEKLDNYQAVPARLLNDHPGQPIWIQYEFAQPITCRSLILANSSWHDDSSMDELQVSDDGVTFRKVATLHPHGNFDFPAATGKFFRIWLPQVPAGLPELDFNQIALGGARIEKLHDRDGLGTPLDLKFIDMPLGPDEIIDPKKLVDLTGKHEWQAPPGHWTLLRMGHTSLGVTTHPAATPGLECDKLSQAAVAFHIQHMFGPVFHDSPEQVGHSLKYFLLDSWEAGGENWTPLLREEFRKRRGYDPEPWLPVLTGRVVDSLETSQRFLWDFRRTLADLLADNHYGTFQAIAHQHHMGLYSEAVGIGMPTVADELQCKGRTDVPMGEFWIYQKGDTNVDDPKEAASGAHIYGKPLAAAESFTAGPNEAAWTNDPASMKLEGDKEFCLGINQFVFHRYAHQPWLDRQPGMSMGPYGINFERTNTWWKPGSAWISYLSRCQYLLQQGRFDADLCYFYGEDAPVCFQHTQLKPAVPKGYDYDVCNAEIILQHMKVEDGRIALDGGMHYRVLVLPEKDRMTLPVLRKIAALVHAGATVYGPPPAKSPSLLGYPGNDEELRGLVREVWGDCDGQKVTEHAYGQGRVVWGQPLDKLLAVAPDFEASQNDVLFIHRSKANEEIYFLSNQQATGRTVDCTFRVAGKIPELWHPDTGQMETAALVRTADGRTTLPIAFDPSGSIFVIFRRDAVGPAPIASILHNGQPFLGGEGEPAAEPPVVVDGGVGLLAWQPGAYIATKADGGTLKADVALPAPLTVDGPWQLAFPPKLGAPAQATFDHLISWPGSTDEGIRYFSGTATYHRDLTVPAEFLAPGRHLYLDLGEVKNLAQVSVNGKSCGILWKAPFRAEITEAVKAGANQLDIQVTNLWPNRLIGDSKLPPAQRVSWASVELYHPDSPLLPSGLLGPVRLVAAQQVTLKP